MNEIINAAIVVIAVVCMLLAQRKTASRADRRLFGLLGSMASAMVAVKASQNGEMSTMLLFAGAAGFGLIGLVLDYLKPTKPDA